MNEIQELVELMRENPDKYRIILETALRFLSPEAVKVFRCIEDSPGIVYTRIYIHSELRHGELIRTLEELKNCGLIYVEDTHYYPLKTSEQLYNVYGITNVPELVPYTLRIGEQQVVDLLERHSGKFLVAEDGVSDLEFWVDVDFLDSRG